MSLFELLANRIMVYIVHFLMTNNDQIRLVDNSSPTFSVHLYCAIIHLSAVSRFQTKALCGGERMGLGVERWSDRKQWKIRAMMRRPHSFPISNLSLFRPFQSCGFYIMCNSDNGGNGGEVRVKRLGACVLKDNRSSMP